MLYQLIFTRLSCVLSHHLSKDTKRFFFLGPGTEESHFLQSSTFIYLFFLSTHTHLQVLVPDSHISNSGVLNNTVFINICLMDWTGKFACSNIKTYSFGLMEITFTTRHDRSHSRFINMFQCPSPVNLSHR